MAADSKSPGGSAPANDGVSTGHPASRTTRLRCLWPHTSFDPSLDGVDRIRDSGTDVPSSQLEFIHAAAKASGVRLQEVKR